MHFIATCAFGLEKLVYDEIKKLGLWVIKTEDGRVTFTATGQNTSAPDTLAKEEISAMVRANLWLRCSEQVQIKMAEFKAQTFDDLFDQINAVPWEKYIGRRDAFPISATSIKSLLHSEPAIQSIIKKAIVKRLLKAHSTETLPENSGVICQITVKANKDEFVVGLNTSGESLHKRGYRRKANIAPIKETLAAALVKLSDWTPARTLIDPFCGSGTILIEAAMIAQNIAPGLTRQFAFQQWPWIDQKMVLDLRHEARNAMKLAENLPIYGYDIDPEVLNIAQENAQKSGIFEIKNEELKTKNGGLTFKQSDFRDLDFSTFENATFIANPPYGERLEDTIQVEHLYRELGKKFKQTRNCSLFLITSNENFPQLFGRPADKNRKLFNGNIRCYLYSFLGIKNASLKA